jgi:hypothetical protein
MEHFDISKGTSDNRYLPRWKSRNRVLCSDRENNSYEAFTRDLSCAGACLETPPQSLSTNQRIELTIYLDEKTTLFVHGHVVWVRKEQEKETAGIHFYNMTDDDHQAILKHSFEVTRDMRNVWFKGWK